MANNEVESFFHSIETTFGGPVTFKTFSFFYRYDDAKVVTTSGLLCIVNSVLYFEDFERSNNGIMGLFGGKRAEYRKFKIHRPVSDVESCFIVSASSAAAFLEGKVHRDALAEPKGVQKYLGKQRVCIRFRDSGDWIIEPIDAKQLMKVLEERI